MEITQARVRELFDYLDGTLVERTVRSSRNRIGDTVGCLHKPTGYFVVRVGDKLHKVHRLIFLWHHGWLPEIVDHTDMDRKNNRIENLRAATKSQNMANRGHQGNSSTKLKGAWFHKQSGRWGSSIKVNGKKINLGLHDTPEKAHAAYIEAARKHFGEFARAA